MQYKSIYTKHYTSAPSVCDVEKSISKYGVYCNIKFTKYRNGEGTVKATNIEREKYKGYYRRGHRVELVPDKATGKPIFDRTGKKVLIKWYQRGETLEELQKESNVLDLGSADLSKFISPSFIDADGKLIQNIKEVFRYVPRNEVKGGSFIGTRHEWKKGEQIEQTRLTPFAKKQIKRAARLMKWQAGKTRFITLTYGKDAPDCKEAKKHLKQFIQRLQRKFGQSFNYVWVAEMQRGKILENGRESYRVKNGAAIHFHLLIDREIVQNILNEKEVKEYAELQSKATICKALKDKINPIVKKKLAAYRQRMSEIEQENIYHNQMTIPEHIIKRLNRAIEKDKTMVYSNEIYARKWVTSAWGEIVNKWQSDNGKPYQQINVVDCESVNDAGSYISKYVSKNEESIMGRMWGMSDNTRELIKPIDEQNILIQPKYCNKILQEAAGHFFAEHRMITVVNMKHTFKNRKTGIEESIMRLTVVPIKPEKYFCITDSKSACFNKIDEIKSIKTDYGKKLDLHIEAPDYQYKPDYPIIWTNDVDLMRQYIEATIKFYDKNTHLRRDITSANNLLDKELQIKQYAECAYF